MNLGITGVSNLGRWCVDHLMRPPVHAGWSLRCVCLKMQREPERKALQEEVKAGEAGGAPPLPAFGDTHMPTSGGWAVLKATAENFCHLT